MVRISVVIVSGSTKLNEHVRINCLWRCVNSMHEDPGMPFELILVDNSVTPLHRAAINHIYDTYSSVTHIIKNRVNERHGGGMRQGVHVADGDIIVSAPDDVLVTPGWLPVLIAPLIETDGRYIGSLGRGVNTRGKRCGEIEVAGRPYTLWTRAGHFVWAIRRADYEVLGPWKRRHFADTRIARKAVVAGFVWTAPKHGRWLDYTNLNYLRPWVYRDKRPFRDFKFRYLDIVWEKGLVTGEPYRPTQKYPLKGLPTEEQLAKDAEDTGLQAGV